MKLKTDETYYNLPEGMPAPSTGDRLILGNDGNFVVVNTTYILDENNGFEIIVHAVANLESV